MPLYEYECPACEQRFEIVESHKDKPRKTCPDCKSRRLRRLISAPAVHFKGTGWYVTDYAGAKDKKGKDQAAAGGSDDSSAKVVDSGDSKSSGDKADKADKGSSKKESKPDSSAKSDSKASKAPAS